MKKFLTLLLICILLLTGCSESVPQTGNAVLDDSPVPAPVNVLPVDEEPASAPQESDLPQASAPAPSPVPTPAPSVLEAVSGVPADPTPLTVPDTVSITITGLGGDIILPATQIPYADGLTPFDVLKQVCDQNGITMKSRGRGSFVYVNAINGISEFDHGGLSGWLYFVNGVKLDQGSGSYKLELHDNVAWKYTVDGIN